MGVQVHEFDLRRQRRLYRREWLVNVYWIMHGVVPGSPSVAVSHWLSGRCLCAIPSTAAGNEWKCIFAEHTSPHIKTPIFPLQGEYDSWQMCCDAGYETKDQKTTAVINAW